ncbi:MAG: epoxide hydrolase, partial [Hymenobacter sp.]
MKITPFTSTVPHSALDDLQLRIRNTRWPEDALEEGWLSGTNLDYLKELTLYWSTQFSWGQVEDRINSYPNFIAEIDGFNIHFVHIKGKGSQSLPIIITHGWPGSFLEMLDIIPFLGEN